MKEKMQREYSIPFELFAKAFTLFQKKFVYPGAGSSPHF